MNLAKTKALFPLLLVALVFLVSASSASAGKAKKLQPAKLVEAANYIPCDGRCPQSGEPVSAFCFRLGDKAMVAEESGDMHNAEISNLEDHVGKQVYLRSNHRALWITSSDFYTIKLHRGSRYRNFHDAACVREVSGPILAQARHARRPRSVPPDAFAVAGPGIGSYQPLTLWYQCSMESVSAGIACRRWFRNGDAYGTDWYCAHTVDGAPVAPGFDFDPLLSQAGHMVLASGVVLQHDNRSRTGDLLDHPAEACR